MPPYRRVLSTVLLACCLGWGSPFSGIAQELPGPILATDLYKIRELDAVALAPNGREVVYTVRSIVPPSDDEGRYSYRTQLYLASVDGTTPPRQLTFREEGASEPAWHPDGDRLAFVRPVDGTPQIFVLPLLGGEAYRVTHSPHGASAPRFSPDGSKLLFASTLSARDVRERIGRAPGWPAERPGRAPGDTDGAAPDPDGPLSGIRAWLDRNAHEGSPRVFTRLDLQGELDLEHEPSYRHLFVLDLEDRESGPQALTHGYHSFHGGAWLPDSRSVVFSGAVALDRHPDRVRDSDLFIVEADGSGFRPLLDLEGYAVYAPQPSPDGQSLAFLARSPGSSYAQTELGLVGLSAEQEAELLTLDFDRSPADVRWAPDAWHLYFTAPSDGGFPLFRTTAYPAPPAADTLTAPPTPDTTSAPAAAADTVAAGPTATDPAAADTVAADDVAVADSTATEGPRPPVREIERLTGFDRGIRSYDVGRASIFYVVTEAANPYELYASDHSFSRERPLTGHNASWLAERRLSRPERRTLRRDSLEIDYWIMEPTFQEEGATYPLLVQMHGGPAAMWGPGEATMWHEFQFFAARGYGLVYANPRGSGGYGHAFERANYQDWGAGPAADVLAAADSAARLPWVDATRQLLTGGSYAGYLTAWIVAHDHRFRAAAAQRGVYDLATFLGEGNAWRLVPDHFGGYPWDAPAGAAPEPDPSADTTAAPAPRPAAPDIRTILARNSPITYVDSIRTPLLILHSDQDRRTGVVQSEMLYKSLKILGRPVEYVRYPDAGHDLSRTGAPRHRVDRILRLYEFFERFL